MNSNSFTPLSPKVVLGIVAHPDDLDFGASGTLAQFAADGAEVRYLILTDGSKGSEDKTMTSEQLTSIRHDEQAAALKALGGSGVDFLDYPDGQLEVTMDLKKDIIKLIRTYKPDVVVTMDPTVVYSADHGFINHPDHRAAGQATLDAVFPLARDHMSFPELYEEGYEPHKTPTVLLINFDKPNFYVDVSAVVDKKFTAMSAHKSQGFDTKATRERVSELMSMMGQAAGCKFAEGFVRIDVQG